MEPLRIFCVNDGLPHKVEAGTALQDIAPGSVRDPKTGRTYPVLAAVVDNKLKELSMRLYEPHRVEFIGYNHPDGRRTYIRSLSFVLQKAVRALFPDKTLVVDHSLPSGLYCEIQERRRDGDGHSVVCPCPPEQLDRIRARMQDIVDADFPFGKRRVPVEQATEIFLANGQPCKADLQQSLGKFSCKVYSLDGTMDSFHGPLVPSSGCLKVFDLIPYGNGFCLQYPSSSDPSRVIPYRQQEKLAAQLKDYSSWCEITGIIGVGTLNREILSGGAVRLINLSEARQERQYAAIADRIYACRDRVKIVFLAGPSSSGKTSSSLRIAQQCHVVGLNPKVIELDNYFVDRDQTPRDEDGNYDYECLEAMDLALLGENLNGLLEGKTVELPRYDFKAGRKVFDGRTMSLGEKDILIMEGIHALDPAMVPDVDPSKIFRVYASALTSLNLDENNNLSTSDNRMLRRMVRDFNYRGHTPENTILGWQNVRRGEEKYIFPFQENADVLMNTALMYELPMLKYYAEPLLRRIPPTSPAYTEAVRLLKFLEYIVALTPADIAAIPPTSIMREFIGGQTL